MEGVDSAFLPWGLLCLVLLSGCPSADSPADTFALDPNAISRGKNLFVGTCAAYCHGMQPGHRDAPYLFDCEWKHGEDDSDVFRVIREGVPSTRMPSFADKLPEGDDDIWKLIAFLRTKSTCR